MPKMGETLIALMEKIILKISVIIIWVNVAIIMTGKK
tara:strand:- start:138 stop:248 length:111 start_codon:yes stop_codon:yes gene_type:complete